MSVNKAILIGNLGNDPELNRTSSGTAVVNLSIATHRKWTGRDGSTQEETQWHRVVVWGTSAERCHQYLRKGSKVFIEGRLSTSSWTDRDGVDRRRTEIVARRVQFLDRRAVRDDVARAA